MKTVACFLLFSGTLAAQGVWDEYGRPKELASTRNIFVQAGDDLDVRENIISEIEDDVSPNTFVFVDSPEEADTILIFSGEDDEKQARAQMVALRIVRREGEEPRTRLIWSDKQKRLGAWGRRLSGVLADSFVSAYKEQNSGSGE